MLIDTHCHLNFKDFKDDFLEVADRSLKEGVFMVVVGSEHKTSERAVSLAGEFDRGVYASVGLHPIHLEDFLIKNNNENGKYEFRSKGEQLIIEKYQNLIKTSSKIVAIGEIGLDYYHINAKSEEDENSIKKKQKDAFIAQLELAKKNNLPVIIHCRDAHDDLYDILTDFKSKNNFSADWGVVHCFSGDYSMAQKYFSLGLKISFTGLITFVRQWDEVIRKSPLDKIMIETDAPYLSPVPHRSKRNEPLYVKEVAKKIAEIRQEPLEEVEKVLFESSLKFFNIKID